MPKSRRVIDVITTDEHGGSIYGLMSPDVVLESIDAEGNRIPWVPQQSKTQQSIWAWRNLDVQAVIDLAGDDEIIVHNLADVTHGLRFMSELVSTRGSDQVLIAAENQRQWLRLPNVKKLRLLKGTGVHEFGEGTTPLLVEAILRPEFPDKDISVAYHYKTEIDGLRLDLAHHGAPPGIRKWLEGNILELYARDIIIKKLLAHKEPPHLIARGHFHHFITRVSTVQANGFTHEARVTLCPSYCMTDDHARKVGRSPDSIVIGLIALEIIDGALVKQHEFRRTIDFGTREVL
jgi:hypothetical protein